MRRRSGGAPLAQFEVIAEQFPVFRVLAAG
jgi:hypothetical protein